MQATTIKLDGALVRRLRTVKPRHETLTGFVRNVLDAEIRRQQQRAAAEEYNQLLREHPDEPDAVAAWAGTPLDRPLKLRSAK